MQPLYRPRRGRRNDGGKPETVTPPALRDVRAELPCLAATTYLNSGAIGPLALPAAGRCRPGPPAPRRGRGVTGGLRAHRGPGRGRARRRGPPGGRGAGHGRPHGQHHARAQCRGLGDRLAAWGRDRHDGARAPGRDRSPGRRGPPHGRPTAGGRGRAGRGRPRGGGRPDRRSADPPRGPLARLLVHRGRPGRGRGGPRGPRRRRPDRRGRRPVGGHDPGRRDGARRRRVRLSRPQVAARPEGVGALWVRPEAMERIDVTVAGLESAAGGAAHGEFGAMEPHPGAPLRGLDAAGRPAGRVGGEPGGSGSAGPGSTPGSARPRPPRGRPSSGCRAWRC